MILFKYSGYTDFEVDSSLLSSPEDSIRRIEASVREGDKFADISVDNILWEIAQSKNNPFAGMKKEDIVQELKRLKIESDDLIQSIREANIFNEKDKAVELIKQRDGINIKRQLLTNTYASRFDRTFIRLSLISNPEPFLYNGEEANEDVPEGEMIFRIDSVLRKDYIKFVIDTMIKNGSFPPYGFASAVSFTNSGEDLFQWAQELNNDLEKKRKILSKMDELTRGKGASEVYRVVVSAWFGGYLLNLPTYKQIQAQFPQHTIWKQNLRGIRPTKEVRKYDKDFGRKQTLLEFQDDYKIGTYLGELDKAIGKHRYLDYD